MLGWIILTRGSYLLTFKNESDFSCPTELIDLQQFNVIRDAEDGDPLKFEVHSAKRTVSFTADSIYEREDWFRAIYSCIIHHLRRVSDISWLANESKKEDDSLLTIEPTWKSTIHM